MFKWLRKHWKQYRVMLWEQQSGISANEWREFKQWKRNKEKEDD